MAQNMFIKFEEPGITGEATDATHKNEIEIMSWSHGFSQPTSATRVSAGGGTVEKANHSDFSFTKYMDSSTDDLLKYCWSGKHIGKATVCCYRSDGNNTPTLYLKIVMEQVIVSNLSVGGGGGDIPVESVSLSYGKVTYTYVPQAETDGSAGGDEPVYHDLKTNEVG